MEKYWVANPDVPGEHRFRAMMAVKDYTMGVNCDHHRSLSVIAGGGRFIQEKTIWDNYPKEAALHNAKVVAGIEEPMTNACCGAKKFPSLPYPEKFEAKVWKAPKK